MSIETTLDLPSKGLTYDIPLSEIKIRPLKGGDEKLLAELSVDNIEIKYLALLKNKIKNGDPVIKGIDPSKLTLGDRLYILLWLRINSYSPIFKSSLVCQNCFKEVHIDIDLTKIEEKSLPEDFKQPYEIILANSDKLFLRLFTIDDEIKSYEKEKRDGTESTYLYRLALSMVDSRSILERISYLEDLPSSDLAKIKYFHESHIHGPILDNIAYTCPKCQEVGQLTLPFRPNWLLPSGTEIFGGNFK